jgi:hypothetical protein
MRLKGGGCGCNAGKTPFFSGGSAFGPPSFSNVPISSFYPYNPHDVPSDPLAPVNVVDARLAPSPMVNPLSTQMGGKIRQKKSKQKKSKKINKKQKKIMGGTVIDNLNINNGLPNTVASLIGTSNISPVSQLFNTNTYSSSMHHNLASINDFYNAIQPLV